MICKNCNAEIDNAAVFCINCGTPVENEPATPQAQPTYQQPAYQQPAQPVYQQPVYQQPVYQQPVYQQPVYQQPVQQPAYEEGYEEDDNLAPITRVGQYVGWFFISLIPIIGFPILTIVFACIRNKNNKNRANFFAAIWAFLGVILAIAAFIGLLALLFILIMEMM